MNEFLPRTDPVAAVVSATERGLPRAPSVPVPSASEAPADAVAAPQQDTQLTERSAVAADYARIQADIANAIAQLDPPRSTGGADAAARADERLMALMPQPLIILPMRPTSQHMVEFVAQVAQTIAAQAARAHAAQARVSPAVVDTLIH